VNLAMFVTISILFRMSSRLAASILAAARDSALPSGKFPGFGVAGRGSVSRGLFVIFAFGTVERSCGYCAHEPSG
jgi:hypothetical protein